ncbi:MAG TPA: hypothetical protein EYN89_13720 [Flavobacteriales bacterium]|nr:hypothetical protein [Flavobacteriales bacterium]
MNTLIRNTLFFSIFFPLVLTFVSCSQVNIDKELLLIDSLQTMIVEAERKSKEIDIESIRTYKEAMEDQLNLFKTQYSDSISWESAKFLNRYHAIKKSFHKYLDKNIRFEDEITYSHDQLKNLKHDLEENIIHLDTFKRNFTVELLAVKDLKILIDKEVENLKNKLEEYREANPKVEELIKKLKSAKDSIRD